MRSKKPATKRTPRRNEETTSSTYLSPSTDEDQTDYNLPFANQSFKSTKKSGESREKDTRADKRNPIETPPRSSARNTRHTQPTVAPENTVDDLDLIGKRNARNQPGTSRQRSDQIDKLRGNTTSQKTRSVPHRNRREDSDTDSECAEPVATENNPHRRRNHQLPMRRHDFQIPRAALFRVIREILFDLAPEGFKITTLALDALQESVELYLTIFLSDSYKCTLHRGRLTLSVKDLQLVRYLRGVQDPGNR